jgi:hypothetical protein
MGSLPSSIFLILQWNISTQSPKKKWNLRYSPKQQLVRFHGMPPFLLAYVGYIYIYEKGRTLGKEYGMKWGVIGNTFEKHKEEPIESWGTSLRIDYPQGKKMDPLGCVFNCVINCNGFYWHNWSFNDTIGLDSLIIRVKLFVTDRYLITEHFFGSSSFVLHFEWFKMLWEHYIKF